MYYNIADVVKNAFTDKDEHLTKAFQKEKHAKGICEQKLESSLIKSLSEKLINSVLFDSGFCLIVDVAQLDHAVIVQFSGVARSQ